MLDKLRGKPSGGDGAEAKIPRARVGGGRQRQEVEGGCGEAERKTECEKGEAGREGGGNAEGDRMGSCREKGPRGRAEEKS